MKNNIVLKNGIIIPEHEIEINSSRSGGAGGQHVNKTNTRITVRWNVTTTTALNEEQKTRVVQKLQNHLTAEGDLIIHNSESRSQEHNKRAALTQLARMLERALIIPKKRIATRTPAAVKEKHLQAKAHRSFVKKMRKTEFEE